MTRIKGTVLNYWWCRIYLHRGELSVVVSVKQWDWLPTQRFLHISLEHGIEHTLSKCTPVD